MRKVLALFLLSAAPITVIATPVKHAFDMGPSDIFASGGNGSFFWDTDTSSISNLTWDFGNGRVGGVDDVRANWSQDVFGGTLAEFTFDILAGSGVHPLNCGGGATGCAFGFDASHGVVPGGFPGPLGDMAFAVDNLVLAYQVRLNLFELPHEGFFSTATATPAAVSEPGTLSMLAAGIAALFFARRKRPIQRIRKQAASSKVAGTDSLQQCH